METDGETAALSAEGIWFAYRGHEWVIEDVSLSVPQGKVTIITGPSGSGKTTLLKVLAGILRPQRGTVRVLAHESDGNRSGRHSLVGYIPQQLGLVRNLTALENVLMGALGRCGHGRTLLGLFPRREAEQAQRALETMGIAHKSHERVFRLSGGERQRVAIARTLLQRPRVVLADELVSDLDLPLASEILGRMRQAADREGLTFVMNMHDVHLVREFGDRVFVMNRGRILREVPHDSLARASFPQILQ